MNTRSGSVDPGALVYLLRERGLDAEELDRALNTESGLTALGGATGEELEQAAAGATPTRELALEVFAHRIAGAVAAMAVAAGRLDALVFTGGIGENSPARSASGSAAGSACSACASTRPRTRARSRDCDIPPTAPVPVLVVAAREELVIARAVRVAHRLSPRGSGQAWMWDSGRSLFRNPTAG